MEWNGTLVFRGKMSVSGNRSNGKQKQNTFWVNCAVKTARTSQSQTDVPESKSRHADQEAM
jgi:hypothetical protein